MSKITKPLSTQYVADEFTLNCKGVCQSGNVDVPGFTEQLQFAIEDKRYRIHFIAHMGNFIRFKFANAIYTLRYASDSDSWVPDT